MTRADGMLGRSFEGPEVRVWLGRSPTLARGPDVGQLDAADPAGRPRWRGHRPGLESGFECFQVGAEAEAFILRRRDPPPFIRYRISDIALV